MERSDDQLSDSAVLMVSIGQFTVGDGVGVSIPLAYRHRIVLETIWRLIKRDQSQGAAAQSYPSKMWVPRYNVHKVRELDPEDVFQGRIFRASLFNHCQICMNVIFDTRLPFIPSELDT